MRDALPSEQLAACWAEIDALDGHDDPTPLLDRVVELEAAAREAQASDRAHRGDRP